MKFGRAGDCLARWPGVSLSSAQLAAGVRVNLEFDAEHDAGKATAWMRSVADRIGPRGWHMQVFANLPLLGACSAMLGTLGLPLVFDHHASAQARLGLKQAPDAVRAVLLYNVAQEIARCGVGRLAALQRMRERSDRHGFGVNLGDVVPGVHAFAVPVRGSQGDAFASLCLLETPSPSSSPHGADRLTAVHAELCAAADILGAEARRLHL